MTDRQRKFADEFVFDCNATRAYKVAYPNIKNDSVARANGSRLLANADIKRYIQEKLDEISSAKTAKAAEVMEYLTSVMRGQSRANIVVAEDGVPVLIEKPPDEKERLKAAELLGKRYGLFTDRIGVEGAGVVQIVDNIPEGDADD